GHLLHCGDGRLARNTAVRRSKAVAAECGQQLDVTPDAVRTVGASIRLCRIAVNERLGVAHCWYPGTPTGTLGAVPQQAAEGSCLASAANVSSSASSSSGGSDVTR